MGLGAGISTCKKAEAWLKSALLRSSLGITSLILDFNTNTTADSHIGCIVTATGNSDCTQHALRDECIHALKKMKNAPKRPLLDGYFAPVVSED
ncbi:hypothetical protein CC78DRAFT_584072 [Lojkania enalia]|uniref:Uncharacterized protein n=1 Tax=Lojkania enalia TaxID=147567 RepID=A0A9P4N087_9PLEO|nr:hypothetical protein CC78DRAFT_584072 [Didymosphaeria enalia]